jgi:hypothetical protein
MNLSHFLVVAVALAACHKNPGTIQTATVGAAVSVPGATNANSDDPNCQFPDTTKLIEPTVIADLPDGVSSDHRGPYIKGVGGVIDSRVGNEAVLTIYHQKADTITNPRTFSVNLSKPVSRGGGVPLGIVTSDNRWPMHGVGILAQWGNIGDSFQNLNKIDVGQTVKAAQVNVNLNIGGRFHVLQMGPQAHGHCMTRSNLVHGKGTSSGTIHRASQTKWVVDVPAGSIGRLFDVADGNRRAVDKGLYYVHVHYEIGR